MSTDDHPRAIVLDECQGCVPLVHCFEALSSSAPNSLPFEVACFMFYLFFIPLSSLMFWTNWNERSSSIMRASLSGGNVLAVISSDIRMPSGLTIDHHTEKLYFSDARLDRIERCEYDGSHRYVSPCTHLRCGSIFMYHPLPPFLLDCYGVLSHSCPPCRWC